MRACAPYFEKRDLGPIRSSLKTYHHIVLGLIGTGARWRGSWMQCLKVVPGMSKLNASKREFSARSCIHEAPDDGSES